jgi:hypothetical protein
MTRLGIRSLATALLAGFSSIANLRAETAAQAPDFKEVYDLVAAHLSGMSQADLNRTSVQALVSALSPRVSLAGGQDAAAGAGAQPVSKASLFDDQVAYLRIGRVSGGLADALREAYQKLTGTNKLNGLVLDLRYAGGDEYAAAAGAADLFVKKERPLLDWGNGVARSKEKPATLTAPVAVLMNRQTTGAAEALAAVLRDAGAGLLVGARTAGQAMVAEEYPLRDGQRLRIATGPVRLGDGTALSPEGVKPDITVEVNPQEERAYYGDPFKELPKTNLLAATTISVTNPANGTNRTRRARFNEAELVRERKEGADLDLETPGSETDTGKTVVRDPALARALDVLKGLAVVRQSRF